MVQPSFRWLGRDNLFYRNMHRFVTTLKSGMSEKNQAAYGRTYSQNAAKTAVQITGHYYFISCMHEMYARIHEIYAYMHEMYTYVVPCNI